MRKVSDEESKISGTLILDFGNKRYKSTKTKREMDWFLIGVSSQKANLSLYLTIDINKHEETLQKMEKNKTGVGCHYINKLKDIEKSI